ncbi:Zinc/iron permease [Globomyces pollinis-pini]|nr:Zinc/iron permease [Globomyces pollinis-pini]
MMFNISKLVVLAGIVASKQSQFGIHKNQDNHCLDTGKLHEDLTWYISSIFIVLIASGLGIAGTMFLGTKKDNTIVVTVLQLSKMFGIGIIAGTVWIHLLPDAFEQFSNPCLTIDFGTYGSAYVGLFGLLATFGIQLIEIGALGTHSHCHSDFVKLTPTPDSLTMETTESNSSNSIVVHSCVPVIDHTHHEHTGQHAAEIPQLSTENEEANRRVIGTYVLEAGILVHSFVIGLTLGMADELELIGLLIAISFHQFFEGVALGSMIVSVKMSGNTKIYLMLLYPLTTPTGIAVGILLSNSFNVNSNTCILIRAILMSLSSGILMYNTYSELMGNEIIRNHTFHQYSNSFKSICFLSMYLGASTMAVLAIWA